MKQKHTDILYRIKNGIIIVIIIPEQSDDPEYNKNDQVDPEKIPG